MHYFEVNIRICQPDNSDVGEHHFRGLTNCDVNQKRMHYLFCYITLSLFSLFCRKSFHIKSDVPNALKTKLFQQLLFKCLKHL